MGMQEQTMSSSMSVSSQRVIASTSDFSMPRMRRCDATKALETDGGWILRLGGKREPTLSIRDKHGAPLHLRLRVSGDYVTLPKVLFCDAAPPELAALRGQPIKKTDFRATLASLGFRPHVWPVAEAGPYGAGGRHPNKVFSTPRGDVWFAGKSLARGPARGPCGNVRPVLRIDGERGMVKRLRTSLDCIRHEVEAIEALDETVAACEVTQFHGKVNIFMPAMRLSLADLVIAPDDAEAVAEMLLRELSQRLAAFSKRGYAHLDITPDNILLDSAGDLHIGGAGRAEAVARRTLSKGVTPAYAAPEMMRDTPHSNAKADVWSLATVIRSTCFAKESVPAECMPLLAAMLVDDLPQRLSMNQVAERAAALQPSDSVAATRVRALCHAQVQVREKADEATVWAPLESVRRRFVEPRVGGFHDFRVQHHAAPGWVAHDALYRWLVPALGVGVGLLLVMGWLVASATALTGPPHASEVGPS